MGEQEACGWAERLEGYVALAVLVVCMTVIGIGCVQLVRDVGCQARPDYQQHLERQNELLRTENTELKKRASALERLEPAAVRMVEITFAWLGVRG
jgi:hypothetical protein